MSNSCINVVEWPETERTLAFGSLSNAYAKVGTPFAYPSIKYVLQNQTNVPISFSLDGVNSVITLAAGGAFTSDVQTNHGPNSPFKLPAAIQWWAVEEAGAATSGSVFISTWYQKSPYTL